MIAGVIGHNAFTQCTWCYSLLLYMLQVLDIGMQVQVQYVYFTMEADWPQTIVQRTTEEDVNYNFIPILTLYQGTWLQCKCIVHSMALECLLIIFKCLLEYTLRIVEHGHQKHLT